MGHVSKINEDVNELTAEEVNELTDEELVCEVERIVGCSTSMCRHCSNKKIPIAYFINGIRKWCVDGRYGRSGLYPEFRIPKTCDKQRVVNNASNPINNFVYGLIRKYGHILTEDEITNIHKIRSKQVSYAVYVAQQVVNHINESTEEDEESTPIHVHIHIDSVKISMKEWRNPEIKSIYMELSELIRKINKK